MYGIFTYIWVMFRAHVGNYSIHGAYGLVIVNYHMLSFQGRIPDLFRAAARGEKFRRNI